jgi:hypothetical protein
MKSIFMDIVTRQDLESFKVEILEEIRLLLANGSQGTKPFLKSGEVMKILGCSESKLASLRVSGKVPCKKLQGTYYFKLEDIQNLLR